MKGEATTSLTQGETLTNVRRWPAAVSESDEIQRQLSATVLTLFFIDEVPLRQTSCRLPIQADDPRRSDTTCKETNAQQSSRNRH